MPKYNLGTSATRDGILDLIQEREYVKKEKKTGQFTPTIRGIKLIHFLDKLDIIYTNPETTQKWELLLAQIGQGKIRKSDFVEKVEVGNFKTNRKKGNNYYKIERIMYGKFR